MFSADSTQVSNAANYIEDVFSTWLYTGNGSTQTITNGIDLAGKGGLVWIKARNQGSRDHWLQDTARGITNTLNSNTSGAQNALSSNIVSSVTATGFVDGVGWPSGWDMASWTFREQAKFHDVVTYTGNGIAGRTVAHNLGSVPGFFVIKRLDASGDWRAYHRSLGANKFIYFNADLGAYTDSDIWNNTAPTATEFTLGNQNSQNINGATYVAYLFAHDAGGFGLAGTDNVISCGIAYSNSSVNLGFEPQWILDKDLSSGFNWNITDNMRGNGIQSANVLKANSSAAEVNSGTTYFLKPTATGFDVPGSYATGAGFIYIAIRRGPMKVPTDATKVFYPSVQTGVNNSTGQFITAGFPPDLSIEGSADANSAQHWTLDRLRGTSQFIDTSSTSAESSISPYGINYNTSNVGVQNIDFGTTSQTYVDWLFRRAPSFFDQVCYTGAGVFPLTLNHNLGVTPELILLKRRDGAARNWVGWQYQGTNGITGTGQFLNLNLAAAANASTTYNEGFVYGVSATQFAVGEFSSSNNVNSNCVAYLFASCPGVSKIGSYTGTSATQTINCGFTGGARFVLIKRTDSAGNWFVWDTARGMVAGTDPFLRLNTADPQFNANNVYTTTGGFQIVSADAGINVSGGTYIYLAIA